MNHILQLKHCNFVVRNVCKFLKKNQGIHEIPGKFQGLHVFPGRILRSWGLHEIPEI